MDLHQIVDCLFDLERISANRRKQFRSSVNHYVIRVLEFNSVSECLAENFLLKKEIRHLLIEKKLAGKDKSVRRNCSQEIDQIFALALAEKLIPDPETIVIKTQLPVPEMDEQPLFRGPVPKSLPKGYSYKSNEPYCFAFAKWPDHLKGELKTWRTWATDPEVDGRARELRLNENSVMIKIEQLESFFGYLVNILKFPLSQLSMRLTIDIDLLKGYVRWHSYKRFGDRPQTAISSRAFNILKFFNSLANNYFENEEATRAIKKYKKLAGKPITIKDKDKLLEGITIQNLLDAAIREFPKRPDPNLAPNKEQIIRAIRSIGMFMTVLITLRSQNHREALVGVNINRTSAPSQSQLGRWEGFFTGAPGPAHLKVQIGRNGKTNTYTTTIDDKYARYFDEYFDVYRPLLSKDENETTFLLNPNGRPYNTDSFCELIVKGYYRWLGVRITPHNVRDIVATEMHEKTGNVVFAASRLNNTPETMLRHYQRQNDKKAEAMFQLIVRGDKNESPEAASSDLQNIPTATLIQVILNRGVSKDILRTLLL